MGPFDETTGSPGGPLEPLNKIKASKSLYYLMFHFIGQMNQRGRLVQLSKNILEPTRPAVGQIWKGCCPFRCLPTCPCGDAGR